MIDPLDWQGGWLMVRGGRGPSDSAMPGPVAQAGQKVTYHTDPVVMPRPGQPFACSSDEFGASALSPAWSWVRPPSPTAFSVSDGQFSMKTRDTDLHPPAAALASVLTEPAATGEYAVETKVAVDTPVTGMGMGKNYVQGGLASYGDDGSYVKLVSNSIWNTRQTEFGKEVTPVPAGQPNYGNAVVGPVGDWTYLRIVHHTVKGADAYTSYTSLDGAHWDTGATWAANLGAHPRIGLVSMGDSGYTSRFRVRAPERSSRKITPCQGVRAELHPGVCRLQRSAVLTEKPHPLGPAVARLQSVSR